MAGGLMSAVAASLCCIGPLVAVVLGAGGFAAASWFAPLRPYFLVVAFGSLALAWYLTYRRPAAACAPGEACAAPTPRKGAKITLWSITAIMIPVTLFPTLISRLPVSANTAAPNAARVANATELRVRILSMDCVACAKGIEATLRRAPGVLRADVDYDSKSAVIAFDARATSAQRITGIIDATGFKVEQPSVP